MVKAKSIKEGEKMKTRIGITIILSSLAALLVCTGAVQAKPKNVIFFIGDGMGPEQVEAAAIYAYGAPGTLSFESFPYQGGLTTYSANSSITDSAAAATAMATGIKVDNGVISMAYPGNGSDLETLLEYYKSLGKSTGLVSTSYLTDATPAAFGAHEPTRSNTSQIAVDYLNQTQPNVLFGGGGSGMTPAAAQAAGYTVVTDRAGMLALDTEAVTKLSGQFGSGQMRYEFDGLESQPHLSEMTATALSILDNDADGLFLMVEGGNIDHACHNNDLARTIPEVSEFADAVQVAVNWAAGRNDTLILVAADHETGGLTVTANNGASVLPGVTWGGTGHTAANIPVYAWGVNAELISGVMDNTDMLAVAVSDEPIELVSPAYDAVNVSTSPSLEVIVHDPDGTGDPLDVTFFGRENPSFTVVVLPDTQKYLLNAAYPQIFTSQTQWIVDNAVSENIVFMTHEGDLVDTWNSATEWGNANDSISLLDGVVPYGLAVGNHDKYENPADPMYDTVSTYFNQTFPYTRYESEPWYGGHYPAAPDPNGNSNNYQLFSAGGDDYIVLHLEDYPTPAVIAWADGVLKANPARKAIITTHGYMDTGGSYTGKWGSTQYIRDLVTANDNVYFVLCGHFTGEKAKTTTVNGRLVHEMIADYQGRANGGDGWLRILRFEPDEDKVYVRTYSTWHDAYEADSGSQFTLDFPMSGYTFAAIGTNSGVASGANTSITWPGRQMETKYEWYVTVTDATVGTTPGPLWSFTTGSPKAGNPNPANGATGVDVDADLIWSPGVTAVSHDVYFGTDAGNLPLASAQQPGTTYDPGTLQQGTTYYWAIDEHDSVGGVTVGDIWSFTTTLPQPVSIVSAGANWKYFDQVDSDQGAWYSLSFDDSSWVQGPAQLGYGDGDEATVIDGSPIRASYYFRRTFTAAEAYDNLVLNVVRDDGCVVYLNGVEIGRSNMPSGGILWNTWAASVTANENNWWGIPVDPAVAIQPGTNVLAVSVHQATSTSTDVSFNLELLGVVAPGRPVANNDSDTTDEDTPVTIDVLGNDTDPDNDPLVVDSVTQPANGTVVNNGTDVTYTPNGNFNGVDTFTYTATDGTSSSNSATVTVAVNAINDAPVAENQAVAAKENTPKAITLTGTDVDENPLTYYVVDVPIHGLLTGTAPNLVYTPTTGYTGPDRFTFKANDATVDSELATVTITVNANSAPVANPDSYSIDEDGTLNVDAAAGVLFNDTDADGDSLTAILVSDVTQGVLTLNSDGSFTYTPTANVNGSDSFTYKANDATADSAPTAVSITITPVNDNPVANDDSATTNEDTPATIDVLGNDTDLDGDLLSVISVTQPTNGSVVNNGSNVSYTPNTNFFGSDSFTYTAGDGNGGSDSAVVNVTVNPINDPPTADAGMDQTVTDSDGNGQETVTLNGSASSDLDGTIVSYEWDINGDSITDLTGMTVQATFAVGTHAVALTVTDNAGAGASDNVSVTVLEQPAAIDDTANSDIIVSGTITSGSYASTVVSDNAYEAIREIRQGNASSGKSLLEHKWTVNVTGGSDVSFHVEAYRTANSEGDNFVFAYSTDNVTYTNLLTVTKTADDGTLQSAALPSSLSGTVYIRVQDTDRTKGRTSLDTIYIDRMFIRSQGFGPDTTAPSPDPMTWAVAPYAASSTSVSMTATTASDPSGVEYYFDCLTVGGHDSGWQAGATYTDTGLTPGVEYTYQVKARDKSPNLNETAFSSPASATPLDAPPAAPTGLAATAGNGQVSLNWSDNGEPDLAGYNIYRATAAGGPYTQINGALLTASDYLDSAVVNGTTYYYVVAAVDTGSNQSGYSSEVSATPSSVSAVFVTSIVNRPFVPAGKSVKAVAGVTISAAQSGGAVSGDWYFKGALVQTGAAGTTNAAGYTEIVSPPARASAGDVFRFVVTNVTLTGYVYYPGQNVVSEILITYP